MAWLSTRKLGMFSHFCSELGRLWAQAKGSNKALERNLIMQLWSMAPGELDAEDVVGLKRSAWFLKMGVFANSRFCKVRHDPSPLRRGSSFRISILCNNVKPPHKHGFPRLQTL